ncbi:Trk system potassium transporter TrkA [Vineibacter terrae]|uniref:Trk system potassium uptake protein TrkA n=1 Tax=Vineibacter terrae TaxID=2586908 RepID=A0A5C8PTV9_9HYPH|nr:Trk system potassium transporter TrkA [Vineibacter terrae]TXL80278.1 Trk system potassium transporter TrkA [Vineibacter terrae]
MRVIVCGAGQVGTAIARQLAGEGIDVTVVDISPEQARLVDETYDVRGMQGHASHPEVLQRAGAQDADMLIAVTQSDEVNMVACQVAYSLFKVRRRIARVRHAGYLGPDWRGLYAADQLPIDVIISPEVEVAGGIARRLRTPGAFDTVPLADGRVQLLGVQCSSDACALIGRRLGELPQLWPDSGLMVMAVIRQGKAFVPDASTVIELNDQVYLITQPQRVDGVIAFFGHQDRQASRIVIVGGGNVGFSLARQLTQAAPAVSIMMVERNRERAEFVSGELKDAVVVLHGDALDRDVLREANAGAAQTIVAVTDDDETNIFASVLAKREGCSRAIALVNKSTYEPIMPVLGVDVVVNPNAITISTILRYVRPRAVSALYALREDFGEVIETQALPGSRLVRSSLDKLRLPKGMMIGAVVRGEQVFIPTGAFQVEPGDRVIATVTYDALRKAEDILEGA